MIQFQPNLIFQTPDIANHKCGLKLFFINIENTKIAESNTSITIIIFYDFSYKRQEQKQEQTKTILHVVCFTINFFVKWQNHY